MQIAKESKLLTLGCRDYIYPSAIAHKWFDVIDVALIYYWEYLLLNTVKISLEYICL